MPIKVYKNSTYCDISNSVSEWVADIYNNDAEDGMLYFMELQGFPEASKIYCTIRDLMLSGA